MQPVKISGLLTVKLVVFAGSSAAAAAGVRALGLSSEPEQSASSCPQTLAEKPAMSEADSRRREVKGHLDLQPHSSVGA